MGFLSTQHLRQDIKSNIDRLLDSTLQEKMTLEDLLPEIQNAARHLEKNIQEKIQLLEFDFNDLHLSGDYLRTVREGFDDIEQLMRNSQTFIDIITCQNKETLIEHIQQHHRSMLVPLLNIMSKLENDYISLATQTITRKQDLLNQLEIELKKLKQEVDAIKKSFVIYNKNQKMEILREKIHHIYLKRKLLQLTLHHDKLNLYYFNNDHPEELTALKQKADSLRSEFNKFKETVDYDLF